MQHIRRIVSQEDDTKAKTAWYLDYSTLEATYTGMSLALDANRNTATRISHISCADVHNLDRGLTIDQISDDRTSNASNISSSRAHTVYRHSRHIFRQVWLQEYLRSLSDSIDTAPFTTAAHLQDDNPPHSAHPAASPCISNRDRWYRTLMHAYINP